MHKKKCDNKRFITVELLVESYHEIQEVCHDMMELFYKEHMFVFIAIHIQILVPWYGMW